MKKIGVNDLRSINSIPVDRIVISREKKIVISREKKKLWFLTVFKSSNLQSIYFDGWDFFQLL